MSYIPPRVRILAFDPAAGDMGWAVIDVDTDTMIKTVFRYGTLRGPQLIRDRKDKIQAFGKNYTILSVYRVVIAEMIREHRPNYVVYESAFAHKFIQAYASLVLVIHSIRQACDDAFGRDAGAIAPMETKKAVAKNHMAGKSEMRAGVMSHPTIVIKPTKTNDLTTANEHEIDAIAHGCAFVDLRLPTLLMSGPIPEPPEKIKVGSIEEIGTIS